MKRISLKGLKLSAVLLFLLISSICHSDEKIFIPIKIDINCNEDLYVFGWSQKGCIAYIKYYDIGGSCGFCPTYEFIIQSLVNDKILYKEIYGEAMETNCKDNEDNAFSIDTVIDQNKLEIQDSLKKYRIIQNKNLTVYKNGFDFKNDSFTFNFYIKTKDKDLIKSGVIEAADLFANSKKFGSKIIYRYRSGNSDNITGLKVDGCLKSPFEDRVAVILIQTHPTVESRIKDSFRIVGSHLVVGF